MVGLEKQGGYRRETFESTLIYGMGKGLELSGMTWILTMTWPNNGQCDPSFIKETGSDRASQGFEAVETLVKLYQSQWDFLVR